MLISEQGKIWSQWTVWSRWIILSALGDILGILVGGSLAYLFFPHDEIRFSLVIGLIGGLIIGFAQWLLLRQIFIDVDWWIFATGIAWAIGDPLGTIVVTIGKQMIPSLLAACIGSVVIGTILGFSQWLILRKKFMTTSTIWIAATILRLLIGTFIKRIPNLHPALGILIAGVVGAAITGWTLVWLMKNFQPTAPNENV